MTHPPSAQEQAAILAEAAANLRKAGHVAAAIEAYRRSLAIDPGRAAVHFNLGNLLREQGELEEAVAAYRAAIKVEPSLGVAHYNLGLALKDLNRSDQALAAYEAALAASPDLTAARGRLAFGQREQGRYAEARVNFVRLAESAGAEAAVAMRLCAALTMPVIPPSVSEIEDSRRRLDHTLDILAASGGRLSDPAGQVAMTAFYLAYHGRNDRALQEKIARTYRTLCPRLGFTAPHCPTFKRPSGRRIRLAVVSGFLDNPGHTITKLFGPLIERIDRRRFEVVVATPSGRTAFDVERTMPLPPTLFAAQEALAAVAADAIFHTDIGMKPLPGFLAYARLAPVQVATWGHPTTTGLVGSMDLFLSAAHLEPEASDGQHYSERLIRLADPGVCVRRPPDPGAATKADFGLDRGHRHYLCPQTLFRFHPDFDPVLAEILRRDPEGRLVMIAGRHGYWNALLRARFEGANPDLAGRMMFVPEMENDRFLALLKVADVILDPLHFSGGNTSFEAFAMGAPVVTWAAQGLMRGRITHALYHKMGIDGGRAATAAEFVDLALGLAQGGEDRARLVRDIRAQAPGLFEDDGPVREIENVLETALAET